jgi:flagellar protein FlaG
MNIASLGTPAIQTPAAPGTADRAATPQAAATLQAAADTAPAAGAAKKPDPSRDEVDAAVKKLNDSMLGSSQTLQFSVDHDTKKIVVKLIDQDTKEVVRQMPSEEALRIAKSIDESMDKLQGRLIDHTA